MTCAARSADLKTWQYSPRNPILAAEPGEAEGINNSDVDLVVHGGKVYVYYATGDQQTWGGLKRVTFDGTMREFFDHLFP